MQKFAKEKPGLKEYFLKWRSDNGCNWILKFNFRGQNKNVKPGWSLSGMNLQIF